MANKPGKHLCPYRGRPKHGKLQEIDDTNRNARC